VSQAYAIARHQYRPGTDRAGLSIPLLVFVAIETVEVDDVRAKGFEIVSGRDIGTRIPGMVVGEVNRRAISHLNLIILHTGASCIVHCTEHQREGTPHEGDQGNRSRCRYEQRDGPRVSQPKITRTGVGGAFSCVAAWRLRNWTQSVATITIISRANFVKVDALESA
jgi:hypothetical protein